MEQLKLNKFKADPEILEEFNKRVAEELTKNPLQLSKPLLYKPGTKIVILLQEEGETDDDEFKPTEAEIEKGSMGIYLIHLKKEDGTYTSQVCTEENIYPLN